MPPYPVAFRGPYVLCDLDAGILPNCPHADEAGLYLNVVAQRGGGWKVTYVGMTGRSFAERSKEHLIQELGGNYRILDPVEMQLGRSVVIWDGLWRKGRRQRTHEFLSLYESLAPLIKRGLLLTSVALAPLNWSSRLLSRAESAIAARLLSDACLESDGAETFDIADAKARKLRSHSG